MAASDPTPPADQSAPPESPAQALRRIEARLARLENYLHLDPLSDAAVDSLLAPAAGLGPAPAGPSAEEKEAGLEMAIGETWMARIGVLALILGLAFVVTYPSTTLPSLVPCLIGYASVGILLLLARHWRQTMPQIAPILFGGSLFLFYFATLRLHFFSIHPFIASPTVGVLLLTLVLAGLLVVADRMRSELTAGLVATLAVATGLISDAPPSCLGLLLLTAVAAVTLYRRHSWVILLNYALFLVYLAHLLWLFGNPVLGHPFGPVTAAAGNLWYLAAYAALFAGCEFFRRDEADGIAGRLIRTGLNGAGAMLITAINCLLFYTGQMPAIMLLSAIGLLAVSLAAWQHHRSRLATALYACFGYLALSAAINSRFPTPTNFGLLAWQSLLVAATAVWFQSKIIVVANLFIYGGIYLVYLLFAPAAGWVNLSFAIVALAIARILNWRKAHLDLRTELMRNLYLGAATIIIPYGLYHTVPAGWVSLSWLLAAGFYFLTSALLRNRKYRWMGIITLILSIMHVFVADLSRLELIYRIMSTLVLGVVLLVVSVTYARSRGRPLGK